MNYYLITYDLIGKNKDYSALIKAIEQLSLEKPCHPLESVWLIKSLPTSVEIFNKLCTVIDEDDRLLVVQITPNLLTKPEHIFNKDFFKDGF